jgi:tetratricopeptide (TPR) repeat protein/serine/threonine protein kinase
MNDTQSTANRLIEVFNAAQELPPGDERARFLDEACGGDAALRTEVEQLLDADARGTGFLKVNPADPPEGGVTAIYVPSEVAGEQIGPYKLLERIGEGGFGTVWVAEQQRPLRRKVALKILKPGMDSRQVLTRFEAERQALALMDHPNIATVHDGGVTPAGRPFFVMELVKGIPVTEFCDQRQLTPRARLELFLQICQAVQHAHQKGIIHRDLKPSNILVAMHDTRPVVKVIDFGIAKALGQELTDRTMFTGFAEFLGTPLYMSPEQAGQSSLDVDTRSDIYSLGVLLYELLTGSTPFDRERFRKAAEDEIRRIIREEDPPRPSTRLSESKDSLPSISALRHTEPAKLTKLVRGELDWIVMKALEKDRTRRYGTAGTFADDVQRYLDNEAVLACPPSAGYRLRKFVHRHKGAFAAASVVLLLLMLLAIGIGWTVRDRADREARVSGRVAMILTEVEQLQREQKGPQALAALRRAEAAMAGGGTEAATGQHVRDSIRDYEFIDLLERIGMRRTKWHEGKFDNAGADEDYARAFRDYGVDVLHLPPATSIDRLKTRPVIAISLAVAMDDWADAHREATQDVAGAQRLVAVARGIDPEPVRDAIRSTWGNPASEAGAELRRLAESVDAGAQHPTTLVNLAGGLRRAQQMEPALRLLRDAQLVHPQDFWTNYNLGHLLDERKDYEGAVRFYTAAVSARPTAVAALNNLSISLTKHGKPDEAIATCRRAIELDPEFANAHNNLGIALSHQNNVAGAIEAYRKALEIDPKYAAAHGNLGFVFARQKEYDKAVASYRKALELNPDLADVHSNLGNVLVEQGKPEEAAASYLKAIELAPEDAKLYFNHGILLASQKKAGEALTAYRKAVELDPKNGNYYVNLGLVLAGEGEPDEAIAAYRTAIDLNPQDAKAFSGMGAVLVSQGKPDEAIAAWRRSLELKPGNAVLHGNIGAVLSNMGDYEGAIECYRAAIELAPNNAGVQGNLGIALTRVGKAGEAVTAFRRAIELNPNDPEFHSNLGVVLSDQLGDYEAAAECYRTAIRLDPEKPLAHSNLGTALSRLGRLDEALAAHRKALDLDPKLGRACADTAWILATRADVRLRDPREALALAIKAVQLDPADPLNYGCLGVAHYRTGNWKAAVPALEKFVQLSGGGDGSGWFFLAMAHWQLGNKPEARRWYDKAVEWMSRLEESDEEMNRFQQEAAELLKINP